MQVVASGGSVPAVLTSASSHRYAGLVGSFLNWWDGVELWLAGLPFIAQAAVVMPVVLALSYGIAVVLDGALGHGIRLVRGGDGDASGEWDSGSGGGSAR